MSGASLWCILIPKRCWKVVMSTTISKKKCELEAQILQENTDKEEAEVESNFATPTTS
jgi:hypothetical protein